jgi:hypothetical protein
MNNKRKMKKKKKKRMTAFNPETHGRKIDSDLLKHCRPGVLLAFNQTYFQLIQFFNLLPYSQYLSFQVFNQKAKFLLLSLKSTLQKKKKKHTFQ